MLYELPILFPYVLSAEQKAQVLKYYYEHKEQLFPKDAPIYVSPEIRLDIGADIPIGVVQNVVDTPSLLYAEVSLDNFYSAFVDQYSDCAITIGVIADLTQNPIVISDLRFFFTYEYSSALRFQQSIEQTQEENK